VVISHSNADVASSSFGRYFRSVNVDKNNSVITPKSDDMMPGLLSYYSRGIDFTDKANGGMIRKLQVTTQVLGLCFVAEGLLGRSDLRLKLFV
jgi:hypothetical protein